MKIFRLTIIIFSLTLVPILFSVAFGSEPCPASGYIHYGPSRQSIPCYLAPPPSNPTLEEQLGNTKKTQVDYDGTQLIVNQVVDKLEYKMGETIHVTPELVNVGNKTVDVFYHSMLSYTEVTSLNASKVWPPWEIGFIPELTGNATLKPGVPFIGKLMQDTYPIILDAPGKYSITSVAIFDDQVNATQFNHDEFVWSEPLQITVLPEKYVQNETSPIIITQVELDSPYALFPDNQTCTSPPKLGFTNNCLIDLIPGKKIQCGYFIGSSTCEPIHQYTGGTNKACLDPNEIPRAPQWFDMYNTLNKTIQIQLFDVQTLQNMKSWGDESLVPVSITLGPYEKCTYGFGPIDEPLTLDQTNMGFAAAYTFEGKNYTASTTYPLTDLYNDTRTWQYDGNQWTFAKQNTIPVPEFPFAIPVFLVSIASLIVFYRMKIRK